MTADAAPRSVRTAGALALLVALALLAFVVAWWGWQLLAPAREHVPAASPADPVAALKASGLFAGPGAPAAAPGAPVAQTLSGDVRLLGVFAERDGRGYALFRTPSGPRLVAAGGEIAPGVKLSDVRADSIGVDESGGARRIELRNATRPTGAPAPANRPGAPSSGATGAQARNACAPPAGFRGDVIALNAELMGGLIAQPDTLRALLAPGEGGLVVRDDSGFSAMLGLKRGDRILQANGIALTSPDDVVGAVLRPLAARQTVRVTGARDGQPRELWLRNVNC